MNLVLVSIALFVMTGAQDRNQSQRPNAEQRPAMLKIDGDWTVAYIEVDGKKLDDKKLTHVVIKNNTVSYKHDGEEKSWRLEFGPHNMVRCTETGAGKRAKAAEAPDTAAVAAQPKRDGDRDHHTHFGVYVASQDFFCLSINKGHDRRGPAERREGDVRRDNEERRKPDRPDTAARFGQQGPQGAHFVLILRRTATPMPAVK